MNTFGRIVQYARPLGYHVPIYLGLVMLTTLFSVVNFTMLIPLLEVLFNDVNLDKFSSAPESFTFSISYFKELFYHYLGSLIRDRGKIAALNFICISVVISVLLANLFRYLSSLTLDRIRVNVTKNLRKKAFEDVTRFDLEYFTTRRKGDVISRLSTDVVEVEQAIISGFRVLIKEPFLVIGYFLALFSLSVELTLYTLVLIPVAGITISLVVKSLKKAAKTAQENQGKISNTLEETLSSMRVIKAFGGERKVRSKYANEVDAYGKESYKLASRANLASPVSEFLGVSVVALLLIIGGRMVLSGTSELSASGFIGFLILFSQVLNPAKAISAAISHINRGLASAERIFELMDERPKIREKADAKKLSVIRDSVRFEGVSFSYGQKEALHNIDLTIRKGEVVALVGPSGAGKSTIADLIPRFYDPTQGSIAIDGIDLRDYQLHSLRSLIGFVTQESILFHDTVANNIALGEADPEPAAIMEAAKVANAHDFITKLEHGYDTQIGERGLKLSGGERQRLCIARAVYSNPKFLILDEATSSLDARNEKLVQGALQKLLENRTSLVIAHRLSTVKHADRIVVIQDGKIIQSGNHYELLAADGLYRQLTAMQSF